MKPALAAPADRFHTKAPIGVTAATAPTFATTNADPAITEATSYAGLGLRGRRTFTSGEPPDPWVAAGPEHVVQVVNTAFRFNNRSGTALKTIDMFDFFGLGAFYNPGEVAFFDPHVIYDSLHQRWVAIEASFDCFTDAHDETSAPATSTSRSRTAPTRRWAGASSRSATPTRCPTTRASAPRPTRSS